MLYGFTGKVLHVDLTERQLTIEIGRVHV